MALSIRSPQVEKLARELAGRTHNTITDEILLALELRKADLEAKRQEKLKKVDEILARVDKMPRFDTRTPDEILGYDKNGLPT